MLNRSRPRAFTLVELLVVITIVVVLLALLMPAMSNAIYQAQLTSCGASQIKGIGFSVTAYAMDHKRNYPRRPYLEEQSWQLTEIYQGIIFDPDNSFDFRSVLKSHVNLDLLVCPLVAAIQVREEDNDLDSWIHQHFDLWFGWRYRGEDYGEGGEHGMLKIGDRWTFRQNPGTMQRYSFNILVGDQELYDPNRILSTHPDRDNGVLFEELFQNQGYIGLGPLVKVTTSRWAGPRSGGRGLVDRNFGYGDLSVARLNHLRFAEQENRMVPVPERNRYYESWGYWKSVPTN